MTIDAPGVYSMPMEQYHADPVVVPSLSASIAHLLLTRTPRHAWLAHPRLNPRWAPTYSEKFDLGETAHTLLLGDERAVEVHDFPDWRTKAAREARDTARAAGKIPMLAHQHERATRMVASARVQLRQHEDGEQWFNPGAGNPEQTIVWQEGDVWCRIRLDWAPERGNLFPDYKTCAGSAAADDWGKRQLFDHGNDLRAAFYCRGIRAVLKRPSPQYRFVVQELEEPHALNVMALSPSALEQADLKVDFAIDLWRRCLNGNFWPGFPRRTSWVNAPPWVEQSFEDRAAYDIVLRDEGVDMLSLGMLMQAPLDHV